MTDIIEKLKSKSSVERMPEYQLKAGCVDIRTPNFRRNVPPHIRATQKQRRLGFLSFPAFSASASSSASQSSAILRQSSSMAGLSVIFQVHLQSADPAGSETAESVAWVHSLDQNLGLELMACIKPVRQCFYFRDPFGFGRKLTDYQGLPFAVRCSVVTYSRILVIRSRPNLSHREIQIRCPRNA